MKKIIITLTFIIATFTIVAQINVPNRFLKIVTKEAQDEEDVDEYEIMNLIDGVQYAIRTETDENNKLVIRVYDENDQIVAEYPGTAIVYPLYDDVAVPNTNTILIYREQNEDELVNLEEDLIIFRLTSRSNSYEVGNILFGEQSFEAPFGYLRKLISKEVIDGKVIYETEQASLLDAFDTLSIHRVFDYETLLDEETGEVKFELTAINGISTRAMYTLGELSFSIKQELVKDLLSVEFGFKGRIQLEFVLTTKWVWSIWPPPHPAIDEFKLIAHFGLDANLSLSASGKADGNFKLGETPLPATIIVILGIPVIFTNKIVYNLNVNTQIGMMKNFQEGIYGKITVKAGVHYKNGLKAVWEFLPEFGVPTLHSTDFSSYKLGVSVGPELQVTPYDLKILTGKVNFMFGPILTINPTSPQWRVDLKFKKKAELKLQLLDFLGLKITASYSTGFESSDIFLAQGNFDSAKPSLTTLQANNIGTSQATLRGEVTKSGLSNVTGRGFQWGLSSNSMTNIENVGTGLGIFEKHVTGLQSDKSYCFRTYATNTFGTTHGEVSSFKSNPIPNLYLSINPLYNITTNSVTASAQFNRASNAQTVRPDAYGFVWTTNSFPTAANLDTYQYKNSLYVSQDNYASTITGLLPNTEYSVRAYIKYAGKTEFSSIETFKTNFSLTFNINNPTNILNSSAEFFVSVSSNASVSEKGICYSWATHLPTINDLKISYGSGTGSFTAILPNLLGNTYYYARPYAVLSGITYYGEIKSFFTTSFDGGEGTESNPYIITTPEQLAALTISVNAGNTNYNNKYYELGNDIDLSNYQNGEGWIPIGISSTNSFRGNFDGNFKKITGLKINRSETSTFYAGLFGYVTGGIVRNLGVENVEINVNSSNTGGIVGYNTGTVSNCYSIGAINGISNVGGIIGYNTGTVSNCYSTVSLSGNLNIGGIVGSSGNSSNIRNCVALNPSLTRISGASLNFGRIIGLQSGTLSNNIAFAYMLNLDNTSLWSPIGLNTKNGDNIFSGAINSDGTLGSRFINENGWIIENGKLPGFGEALNMPEYLIINPFDNGDGTENNPYIITTPEQFASLAVVVNAGDIYFNDKYYEIGNDIDLSDYQDNEGWIPIGKDNNNSFKGSFNGNFKKITGLKINKNSTSTFYAGLFGYISNGVVKNLGVENLEINVNSSNGGGIVGYNDSSTVSNCFSSGTINGTSNKGGIVGYNNRGIISNCFSIAMICGNNNIGGIVGQNYYGTISNCAALNPSLIRISGTSVTFGRIVGTNNGTLTNNIAFTNIVNHNGTTLWSSSGANNINGVNVGAIIINSDGTLGGLFTVGNGWVTENGKLPGFGVPLEMPEHLIFINYFENGDGTESNPYIIITPEQLAKLAEVVNAGNIDFNDKYYLLGNNIDLINFQDNEGWIPIGEGVNNSFKGYFNGNFKNITGININKNSTSNFYAGLFGYVSAGEVKNLCVKNVEIIVSSTGLVYAGAIVGYNNSIVSNCYSAGIVSGNGNNTTCIGGLVGYNIGKVSNCHSTVTVSSNAIAGGLVGRNMNNSTIESCAALNPSLYLISGTSVSFGRLVGVNSGTLTNNIAFANMINYDDLTIWSQTGSNTINGENIGAHIINLDGTLGERFTSENGWVTENGKIPGFGAAINKPEYLKWMPLITTQALQYGLTGILYNVTLQSEGDKPLNWIVETGNLPDGLTLSEDGIISGTPTLEGLYNFEIKVTNEFGNNKKEFSILIFLSNTDGDGTEEYPYIITTPNQLADLAIQVNAGDSNFNDKYYQLGNDIDLSNYQDGEGWIPIGKDSPFMGYFDGNHNKITGLKINISDNSYGYAPVGLFGIISGGEIKNIGVENIEIIINETDWGYAGGIVGMNGGKVSNSYSTGTINSLITAGGVVGYNDYGSIVSNCYSSVSVSCYGWRWDFAAGGIIGENRGVVSTSYSTNLINGYNLSGGIVGHNYEGTVSNCYSIGEVSSESCAGGIVGQNFGSVTTCYSMAIVSSNYYLGGVVGVNRDNGNTSNCAALNPYLNSISEYSKFGRIVYVNKDEEEGIGEDGLIENIAFAEMLNPESTTSWNPTGAKTLNGENIGTRRIHSDGTLGGRFKSENGWTTENGKLPGFGTAIDMPAHLFAQPGTPLITTTTLPNCINGREYNQTLTVSSNSLINWTINSGGLPKGLTLLDNGIILGIPDTLGVFNFEIKAINNNGSDFKCFSIFVLPDYFDSGEGTIDNPYIITTAIQLAELASFVNEGYDCYNVYFKLGNDINLIDYQSGEGWFPIGVYYPFKGNFDGNNKIISDLKINSSNLWYAGLFGYVSAGSITNVGLLNSDINVSSYNHYVGSLIGYNEGSVSGCYSKGIINNTSNYSSFSGGLVGYSNGSVSNCYSTGAVISNYIVGGLVGANEGIVSNCYSTKTVTSNGINNSYAGGVVGANWEGGIVLNCYSIGVVNSDGNWYSYAGGVAGSGGIVSNCVALNSNISCLGSNKFFGRIVDSYSLLSNNKAFHNMLNPDGNTTWENKGANEIDGEDITADEINADGTLGGRFTDASGWTTENGKLPGLLGETVTMPAHLKCQTLTITTQTIPNGMEGIPYSTTLAANGETPIIWTIETGNLPEGLVLSSSGIISGIPTTAGTSNFTVKATNNVCFDTKSFSIIIEPAPAITFSISTPTNVSYSRATFNVSVSADASVTDKGICFSNNNNMPTTAHTSISQGSGTGSFIITLTGLMANTIYYVRPYAVLYGNTYYGEVISFSTTVNVPIEMILVQGGTFTMGCTTEQGNVCSDNEHPAHQVNVNSFYIGKYKITQSQWLAVMGNNPSVFSGVDLPVESVSWNEIVGTNGASMVIKGITYYEDGFIYKLNQMTEKQYRLPTEAEWEFAARGGNASQGYKFSGSNNIDDVAWYAANSGNQTHIVGSKQPNELGIYDMSGNVLEWCSDWFGENYYSISPQNNPQGPASGNFRVVRGGWWQSLDDFCRVSFRIGSIPDGKANILGVRLVLSSE